MSEEKKSPKEILKDKIIEEFRLLERVLLTRANYEAVRRDSEGAFFGKNSYTQVHEDIKDPENFTHLAIAIPYEKFFKAENLEGVSKERAHVRNQKESVRVQAKHETAYLMSGTSYTLKSVKGVRDRNPINLGDPGYPYDYKGEIGFGITFPIENDAVKEIRRVSIILLDTLSIDYLKEIIDGDAQVSLPKDLLGEVMERRQNEAQRIADNPKEYDLKTIGALKEKVEGRELG